MSLETPAAPRLLSEIPMVWAVPSRSDPKLLRFVQEYDGDLRCDCPAGARELRCRHVAAVWALAEVAVAR